MPLGINPDKNAATLGCIVKSLSPCRVLRSITSMETASITGRRTYALYLTDKTSGTAITPRNQKQAGFPGYHTRNPGTSEKTAPPHK
jgi:hypothetical protein